MTLLTWFALILGLGLGILIPWVTARVVVIVARGRSGRAERRRLASMREDGRPQGKIKAQDLTPRLPAERPRAPYLYLTELYIENFRCFSEARLSLRFPGEGTGLRLPNVNLLLGDNGSGKSTVLRAAAMVALGPLLDSSGFVPYRLVRDGTPRARAAGALAFGGPQGPDALRSEVSVERRGDLEQVRTDTEGPYWSDLFNESTSSFFVVGYGVNRRVADDSRQDPSLERGRRRRRYQRVSSLFDENIAMVPFGSWLPMADRRRREEVTEMLDELLPAGAQFTGSFEGDEPIFRRHDVSVPFRALSDGFRSYLGWLGDLLFQISAVTGPHAKLRDMGGIVLVDEIDLLLHPSWQRVVVPTVSRMFPKIQFIFTTHSPIVTGTLQAENISVAREVEDPRSSVLRRINAEVHGLNAEQVLLSSYFELASTRSPDAASGMAELALRAVAGDEAARRRYLRALIEGPPPGDSRQ
jgi:hypothetical protein